MRHYLQESRWSSNNYVFTKSNLHHGWGLQGSCIIGVLLLTDLLLLCLVCHLQRSLTVGGWGTAGIPGKGLLLILGRVSTSITITIDMGYRCIGLLVAMATMAKFKMASCYDWKTKCYTVMLEYGFSSILSTIKTELKENLQNKEPVPNVERVPMEHISGFLKKKVSKGRFQNDSGLHGIRTLLKKKNGILIF